MIKFEINSIPFFVKSGISILEACEYLGINVPRFCYHQTLSVAGNCRICLVEIANSPKPVASCALPVSNNLKIFTDSPIVKKARENVLEALLLNHPLDCPICDQAGECDLQDQSKIFGVDSNRFFFGKRVVEDKYLGPVIKTIMTRCIHCTRCVRFNSEISGNEIFGTLSRGTAMEIGSYTTNGYISEISANVIDLCPVGALTSFSYSFKSRPWDLKTFESIDLSDGVGSTIYISIKEVEIVRIFSRLNYVSKDVFISDRSRYCFDSQINNRLFVNNSNYINKNKFNNLFLNKISNKKFKNILFLVENSMDFENLVYLKYLNNILRDKHNITYSVKALNISVIKSNYYVNWLNSQLLNIELPSKFCFLISSNLKIENILINTKLRIKALQNNLSIYGFSLFFKDNYNINFFNLKINKIFDFIESKLLLSSFFIKNKYPIFIFGENFFKRGYHYNNLYSILKKINVSSIIFRSHASSNFEGLKFLNITNLTTRILNKKNNDNFIIGLDLTDSFFLKKLLTNIKYIDINTHKSNIKSLYSIPCKTQYEEEKIFINLEQKIQKTTKVISSKKNIFSIKEIILSMFDISFINIKSFSSLYLNFFKELLKKSDIFLSLNNTLIFSYFIFNSKVISFNIISQYPIKNLLEDDYLLNKILQNSKNMQINSQFFRKKSSSF